MRAALFGVLLACSSLAARAQVYYLNLAGAKMPMLDCPAAIEQVLDGRGQQTAIGFVYKGMGNRPATVLFRRGLAPELTEYLQAQLPARSADHPIVLCLRQLRISEEPGGFAEQGHADLAADVYAHLPDGYHFVQSVAARLQERGLDMTGHHANHLAQLLGKCLGQLAQADWAAAAARPALGLSQLVADVPSGARRGTTIPILREAPRRGIYRSFEQFLANQPDTSVVFQVDTVRISYPSAYTHNKWLGVARVRPVATQRGQRLPPEPWGFSDGQQLFVQRRSRYFPLLRQGSSFTFVGEAPLDKEYAQAQATASRGMLPIGGGLVAVASVNAVDHTAEPYGYALDMRTGESAPYPGLNSGVAPRADTAYVYIYRPAAPVGPATVRVWLDNQEMGTLRPGQYLELPCPYRARPLHLRLDGVPSAGACQYIVPNTRRRNYLRVVTAAPGPAWQWMAAAQGEADLDELDRLATPRP